MGYEARGAEILIYLIKLKVSSHMWFVATVLGSTVLEAVTVAWARDDLGH